MEMHEATITAEYVNPPDKNPDYGSVKSGGRYYSVPKNMLSQFTQGDSYTIGYTITKGSKGGTFYNLKEIRSSAASAPTPTVGHNNPPNGNGSDKDKVISALALFKSTAMYVFANSDNLPDRASLGDYFLECRLAVDWTETKYRKFWAEKNTPKPAPAQTIDDTF